MGNNQGNQIVKETNDKNETIDENKLMDDIDEDESDKIIIHDKLMKFYDESLDNFETLHKNLKELTTLQMLNDPNDIIRINEIKKTIDSLMKANNLLNENIKNINSNMIEHIGGKRGKKYKNKKKTRKIKKKIYLK